jgi:HK97 gp10 family phage protein
MSKGDIRIVGDKALLKRLDRIAPAIRKKILRPAVTKAARPIRQAIKARAPVDAGHLKKSIDLKAKSYRHTAVAIVGPRSDMGFARTNLWGQGINSKPNLYSHLVEGGVQPHVIMTGRNRKVMWMHPGSPPKRFLRSAVMATQARAVQILNQEIRRGLEEVA